MDRILVAKNKKAYHNFHIVDRYEAGLVLTGSEVKSIREGKMSLREAYVLVRDREAVLIGSHISSYSSTGYKGHDPKANRKLLLKKREILHLKQSISKKGLTAVPLEVYFNEKGWAKIVIATAKGKRLYDKKEYDLVISEFCISEMDDKGIDDYYEKYLSKSKNIYLLMNMWDEVRKERFVNKVEKDFNLEMFKEFYS